jgi:3-oxoacyl-[acyl-carrier-protein] synthase III
MQWDDMFISGTGRFLPQRVNIADIPIMEELDQIAINAIKLSDYVSFVESSNFTSPEMAGRAATIALSQSGHKSQDIAAIVYAQLNETDHFAPVCHLQRVLGIPDALAFELGAASDGGAMGLEVAANLLKADSSAKATLVTAAVRFQPLRRSNRWYSGGVVMSDGSAAAVLSRGRGLARLITSTHSSMPDFETLCTIRTANADFNAQKAPIFETGLDLYLDDLKMGVVNVVERALLETGIRLSDVAKFAVTGLGLAQLSALVLESLGITLDRTTWPFLREIGHVGPCDQLLGLDYLLRQGQLQQGDIILILGMGTGFRYTCILLEVTELATQQSTSS